MSQQQQLIDLLVKWDRARVHGEELTAEELCRECPELLPILRTRMAQLARISWLEDRHEEGSIDDGLSLPVLSRVSPRETGPTRPHEDTALSELSMSAEVFQQTLTDAGLLSASELRACVEWIESQHTGDVQVLARELIRTGLLTPFQVQMIAQGKAHQLVLGNYVLLEKIGAGGMGQVFKARHRRMKRLVAIKLLPDNLISSKQAIERFHREVEATGKLDHPNIVTSHDADDAGGRHFLAMQYVEGQDLMTLVRSRGPLYAGQAIGLLLQAACGLEYAHKRGIVHRDIKPSNLLLDTEGTLKILDLGLARVTHDHGQTMVRQQAELTQQGVVMGTVDYMSPEQALDTHSADERSDIYSLGCTLFFLLTGDAVFAGQTLMAKMLGHREGVVPSLRDRCPDVPTSLDSIFQRMMAKKPEDRFASMTELISDLEACVKLAEGMAPIPVLSPPASTDLLLPLVTNAKRDTSSAGIDRTTEHKPESEQPAIPAVPSNRPRSNHRLRVVFIALIVLVLAPVAWFAAQIIFRVETHDGELVVEVDDPNIDIVINLNGILVHDKTSKREFTLKQAGKGEVKVYDKKSGLELTTKEFALRQGGTARVIVRHEVAEARAKLAKDKQAVAFVPKDSAPRRTE